MVSAYVTEYNNVIFDVKHSEAEHTSTVQL